MFPSALNLLSPSARAGHASVYTAGSLPPSLPLLLISLLAKIVTRSSVFPTLPLNPHLNLKGWTDHSLIILSLFGLLPVLVMMDLKDGAISGAFVTDRRGRGGVYVYPPSHVALLSKTPSTTTLFEINEL